MQQQGIVVQTNVVTGRFAVHVEDGSYVLAEQLDMQPLRMGEALSGRMDMVGPEVLADTHTAHNYSVSILAYGLSLEAIEEELR